MKKIVKAINTVRGFRYYSLTQKKWISKETAIKRIQRQNAYRIQKQKPKYKKTSKEKKYWFKSVRSRKKYYKRIKKSEWKKSEYGRRKLLASFDIVKLGGVGRTIEITKLKTLLKKTKTKSKSKKIIVIEGYAIDKNGRRIKDKKIMIRDSYGKGVGKIRLADVAYKRLKGQINSFGWAVSSAERRRKKGFKREMIKSLKLKVYIEEV